MESKMDLLKSYLEDQENALVKVPDNDNLEKFKNDVRIWMEIDNNIRNIKKALKERNDAKKVLTNKILEFMGRFNIEDLNTKEGVKLRYQINNVTIKPSKKDIECRLKENFGKVESVDELTQRVFTCQKKEKPTLRRINNRKVLEI